MFAWIPTDRKTQRAFGLCLLVGVLFGGIGGCVVARWRLQPMAIEPFAFWQHAASEQQAKAYLHALEAIEKGGSNDLRRLRLRARAALLVYVREVEGLQKRYAYPWCPLDPDIFERAQDYLARHPRGQTNAQGFDRQQ